MKDHFSILSTARAGSHFMPKFALHCPVVVELVQPGRILGQLFSRDGGKTAFAIWR